MSKKEIDISDTIDEIMTMDDGELKRTAVRLSRNNRPRSAPKRERQQLVVKLHHGLPYLGVLVISLILRIVFYVLRWNR